MYSALIGYDLQNSITIVKQVYTTITLGTMILQRVDMIGDNVKLYLYKRKITGAEKHVLE